MTERRRCSLLKERRRVDRLHEIEEDARREGFTTVAGVDEVGRGCLAGPVYAGAVVLDPATRVLGIDDSKALLSEVRERLAPAIRARALGVGIGAATPAEIDAIGIVEATLLAMRRALLALVAGGVRPDLVLFDAVHLPGLPMPQRAYIKGDARVAAISAASIVAKTERDRLMAGLHQHYPHYGFAAHRGYATAEHLAALHRHGPCPLHRLTFEGVLGGASASSLSATIS